MAAPSPPPPTLRYIDELLSLRCAPELLRCGLFPVQHGAKEATECLAMLAALRQHVLPAAPLSGGDAVVVVGDGSRPRTGALLALTLRGPGGSRPTVYSIDPMLHHDTASGRSFPSSASSATAAHVERWRALRGLVLVRDKVQAIRVAGHRAAILVLMHAHVSVEDAVACVDGAVAAVVTAPCCNWALQQAAWRGRAPDVEYRDAGLLSEHNLVRVWLARDADESPPPPQQQQQFQNIASSCTAAALVPAATRSEAAARARDSVAALAVTRTWAGSCGLRVAAASAAVANLFACSAGQPESVSPTASTPCVVGVVGGRRACATVTFIDLYPLGGLWGAGHEAAGVLHGDDGAVEGSPPQAPPTTSSSAAGDDGAVGDGQSHVPSSAAAASAAPVAPLEGRGGVDLLDDGAAALWRAVAAHAQVDRFVGRATMLPGTGPARRRNAAEELLRASPVASDRMQVVVVVAAAEPPCQSPPPPPPAWLHDLRAGDIALLRLEPARLASGSLIPSVVDGVLLHAAGAAGGRRTVSPALLACGGRA